ncbi:hypothetical protein M885DRAFT_569220 [Pelagophyceae sp. CCMP2097]|nr:hypothetical protein M885DRAFT_569220 [Pelagophyceae sp. CCMP2097]
MCVGLHRGGEDAGSRRAVRFSLDDSTAADLKAAADSTAADSRPVDTADFTAAADSAPPDCGDDAGRVHSGRRGDDAPETFFETFGLCQSKLGSLGGDDTDDAPADDDGECDDGDCDDDDVSPNGGTELEAKTSWATSLKDFALQRTTAASHVKRGAVVTHVRRDSPAVPLEQQGDLGFYAEEAQRKRWRVRHDPNFKSLMASLWLLVTNGNAQLHEAGYLKLVRALHFVVRPPPLDPVFVRDSTLRDWKTDSGGLPTIGYEKLFDAIYQLVDVWTETCVVAEYVALLRRLIGGVAAFGPGGDLKWRSKPLYDPTIDTAEAQRASGKSTFSFDVGKMRVDLRLALLALRAQRAWVARLARGRALRAGRATAALEAKYKVKYDPSAPAAAALSAAATTLNNVGRGWLACMKAKRLAAALAVAAAAVPAVVSKPKKTSKYKQGKKPKAVLQLLTAEQSDAAISRIYQSFILAHSPTKRARKAKKDVRNLRFDAWIIRYFRQLHGTAALAKRHVAAFVRSVEFFLAEDSDTDTPRHARIALFAKVAGISSNASSGVSYNARLMPSFVAEVLRKLFDGDVHRLSKCMQPDANQTTRVPFKAFHEAAISVIDKFEEPRLLLGLEAALKSAKAEGPRGDWVDLDAALWLLLPFYERGDAYTASRRVNAARIASKWVHKWRRRKLAEAGGLAPVAKAAGAIEAVETQASEASSSEPASEASAPPKLVLRELSCKALQFREAQARDRYLNEGRVVESGKVPTGALPTFQKNICEVIQNLLLAKRSGEEEPKRAGMLQRLASVGRANTLRRLFD